MRDAEAQVRRDAFHASPARTTSIALREAKGCVSFRRPLLIN
ncbi:hypothetical protein BMA10247_2482 [Burkholderia mallei NCTC 10247]|uniref:Uncharacterized protein n=1 Tax=Burkholderia pseudomallei (strain 1106a) TaxID=357348 RepID=A3NRD6_BURP0|nr:hypothetical protein BURPS668_0610 [Burkholderia pseudomallei 668]ABN90070.1 hypothetical protein BURPS1106A_0625 [Burkholderia pseudomallei 1106a]ABO04486.1 hypothetical protein BMA10247_2482 [Burkholderia mallei NCTC 10247]